MTSRKPFDRRALTAAGDRTNSRRHRAGSRRNKAHRTAGVFTSDLWAVYGR